MDGLARVAGAVTVPIEIAGVTYDVPRQPWKFWVAWEKTIASERPDILGATATAISSLPADQQELAWKTALKSCREQVSQDEMISWLTTVRGLTWAIGYLLEGQDVEPAAIETTIGGLEVDEMHALVRKVEVIAGMTDLGESDGPKEANPALRAQSA